MVAGSALNFTRCLIVLHMARSVTHLRHRIVLKAFDRRCGLTSARLRVASGPYTVQRQADGSDDRGEARIAPQRPEARVPSDMDEPRGVFAHGVLQPLESLVEIA